MIGRVTGTVSNVLEVKSEAETNKIIDSILNKYDTGYTDRQVIRKKGDIVAIQLTIHFKVK